MKTPILSLGFILLSLAAAVNPLTAEEVPIAPFELESGESSFLVGTPHPALFSDFKIEGYDYLEASLTVEDQGASVTWAPFLPPSPKRDYSFWSETRLQLSQKDDVTSLGVSIQYNPLNPRSDHGRATWKKYWAEVDAADLHSTFPLDLNAAKRVRKSKLEEQVFETLKLLSDEDCPSQISDPEQLRQEVLKKRENPASGSLLYRIHCALAELREPIADLQDEIATLELGADPDADLIKPKKAQLGTWSKAYSTLLSASERAYVEQRTDEPGITELMAIRAEIAELDKSIEATTASYAASAYTGYRAKLYSSKKPIVNVSYINSFFNVISGGEVDNDGDGLNDNGHRLKSRSLALSVDWKLGQRDGVSLQLSRSSERSAAEEEAPSADYNGVAATWSHLITILNKDGYQKTKDFRESLFVPSIVFGIAYEAKDCDSANADCAKGILRTQALTPFVDFKIKKSAQFRIGIPFKRNRIFRAAEGAVDEDTIDIVSLVAFQLGAPN